MKKPLYNEIERQIMHEDKSLYASRMNLHIAKKKFEKAFMKSFVARFIKKTVDLLTSLLA
jgi:RNase P protein component